MHAHRYEDTHSRTQKKIKLTKKKWEWVGKKENRKERKKAKKEKGKGGKKKGRKERGWVLRRRGAREHRSNDLRKKKRVSTKEKSDFAIAQRFSKRKC